MKVQYTIEAVRFADRQVQDVLGTGPFSRDPQNDFESVRSVDHVPYIPAQETPAQQGAWLPRPDGDQERPPGSGCPPSPRPQRADGVRRP